MARTLRGVPADEITSIAMDTETDGAEEGDVLTASVSGRTAEGTRVLGVEPSWESEGVSYGNGDLYTYRYVPGMVHTMNLEWRDLSASFDFEGEPGSVMSSSNIGCSTAWGGTHDGLGVLISALMALGLVIRRRRRA